MKTTDPFVLTISLRIHSETHLDSIKNTSLLIIIIIIIIIFFLFFFLFFFLLFFFLSSQTFESQQKAL